MEFKSSSLYFDDEESGLKNWTIRKKPEEPDARFTVLDNWMKLKSYRDITIIRAKPPNYSFTRQVKHVTMWKNYYCITWRA